MQEVMTVSWYCLRYEIMIHNIVYCISPCIYSHFVSFHSIIDHFHFHHERPAGHPSLLLRMNEVKVLLTGQTSISNTAKELWCLKQKAVNEHHWSRQGEPHYIAHVYKGVYRRDFGIMVAEYRKSVISLRPAQWKDSRCFFQKVILAGEQHVMIVQDDWILIYHTCYLMNNFTNRTVAPQTKDLHLDFHPWTLMWNTIPWRFGRWFCCCKWLILRFKMLIFPGFSCSPSTP